MQRCWKRSPREETREQRPVPPLVVLQQLRQERFEKRRLVRAELLDDGAVRSGVLGLHARSSSYEEPGAALAIFDAELLHGGHRGACAAELVLESSRALLEQWSE